MKLLCYFNSIMCRKMEKCRKATKINNKLQIETNYNGAVKE